MSPVVYRRREEPGCGGCLLVFLLLVLLTGGAPLLFKVLGILFYFVLLSFIVVFALFWGAAFFIKRQISTYEQSQTEVHNRFVSLLVHILVKIARLDGEVTREEAATIRRFFQTRLHYSQSQLFWIRDLVKEAMQSEIALEALLEEFRGAFAYEPRLLLLDLIYQVVFSKGAAKPSELELTRSIARYLEISPWDQRVIEMKFMGGARPAASPEAAARKERRSFEFLGLEPGAPFADIKSSYRKLSLQYHPDKVRHLGEEFRKVAEEKMKELNEAYDFLEKKYGHQTGG